MRRFEAKCESENERLRKVVEAADSLAENARLYYSDSGGDVRISSSLALYFGVRATLDAAQSNKESGQPADINTAEFQEAEEFRRCVNEIGDPHTEFVAAALDMFTFERKRADHWAQRCLRIEAAVMAEVDSLISWGRSERYTVEDGTVSRTVTSETGVAFFRIARALEEALKPEETGK